MGIVSFSFLPIGYILILIQHYIYLKFPVLSIHIRAKERAKGFLFHKLEFLEISEEEEPKDEGTIAAYTIILTNYYKREFGANVTADDWSRIRKRMDILAMDFALYLTSILYLAVIQMIALGNIFYLMKLPARISLFLLGCLILICIAFLTAKRREYTADVLVQIISEVYKIFYKKNIRIIR